MKVLDTVSMILKEKAKDISSIGPQATVYEALLLMAEKDIGALPVIHNAKLVGMFSERDYARKVILKGRSSKDTKVEEIMNAPPITIVPECSVDEAMHIMAERRVRHLPVVDKHGVVLGIVSIRDLVKWIITSHEQTIEQLQTYIAQS